MTAQPTTTAVMAIEKAEDRRRALKRLAVEVVNEDGWAQPGDFSPVVHLIVPTLAAAVVTQPLAVFHELCQATREFSDFCSNESAWLEEHELPTTVATRESTFEALQSNVDYAADRLMGRA